MAETESLIAASTVSEADLARAGKFAREPFIHEGEDPEVVLAADSPRRRALDDALAEIESGRADPSVQWQREYALMLGLERLLTEEQPHLADGTELSAHQVDALSGTLVALITELQAVGRANGNGRNGNANGHGNGVPSEEAVAELEPDEDLELDGEDLDDDDVADAELEDEVVPDDEDEPLDWADEEDEGRDGPTPPPDDPGAARRSWVEHA